MRVGDYSTNLRISWSFCFLLCQKGFDFMQFITKKSLKRLIGQYAHSVISIQQSANSLICSSSPETWILYFHSRFLTCRNFYQSPIVYP
jgi:hypothetical protein